MSAPTSLGYHAGCGGAVVLTEWEEARPGHGCDEPMASVRCARCGEPVDPRLEIRSDPDSAVEEEWE